MALALRELFKTDMTYVQVSIIVLLTSIYTKAHYTTPWTNNLPRSRIDIAHGTLNRAHQVGHCHRRAGRISEINNSLERRVRGRRVV